MSFDHGWSFPERSDIAFVYLIAFFTPWCVIYFFHIFHYLLLNHWYQDGMMFDRLGKMGKVQKNVQIMSHGYNCIIMSIYTNMSIL